MQKLGLLVFFFTLLLSVNASLVTPNLAAAEELADITISEQQITKVDYALPYPGLLPDSPIYFLRIIRDKAVSFLISDPLKKSEFNLLQADKRLNAGIYLINKGKIALALSTVSKAENYFEEALDKIEEAKRQGKNTNEMPGRLNAAVKKHRQEIQLLAEKADVSFKPGFEKELKRVIGFEERLSN